MQMIADRMIPYQKPSMYGKFSLLAQQLGCVNLGQGFPNFEPPQFLRQALSEEMLTSSLQYTQTFGNPKLLKAISQFFGKKIGYFPKENSEIVVSAGATTTLDMCFQGLLNKGDEVILFDPAFDFYRPQIYFAEALPVGVPIIPKQFNSKEDLLKRFGNGKFNYGPQDEWLIDFEKLEKAINPKTKMILINSPVNPSGKVITHQELDRIADLLDKHGHEIVIIEDAAYQHITFGDVPAFSYARPITHPRLKNRTVCVTSGGKLFSATGLRLGFAFGDEKYIKAVKAAQTYHLYCLNDGIQIAAARCFDMDNNYFEETRQLYEKQAQLLLKGLVESSLNLNIWVPNGGYFVVTDISNIDIPEKYFIDPEDGSQLTRDFAFAHYMVNQFKVVCIPCSPFFQQREYGQNMVRWAFCKTTETLEEAARRLKQ